MSYFIRAVKTLTLKSKLTRYKKERILSLNSETQLTAHYVAPKEKDTKLKRYMRRFTRKDGLENYLLKSALGFLAGVVLTYIFFIFFIVGINLPLSSTTYYCCIFGIIGCIGLAFYENVRCYVALFIPVFFSKRGRQALLAYAYILALTGPAKNTVHNFGVLSDSLACGQEQLKRSVRQIVEMVKAPFLSMRSTIAKLMKSLKTAVDSVREMVTRLTRVIKSILSVIAKAGQWLGNIVSFCNKELGTPFQRCMKCFDDAIEDCKAAMGIMGFMCHIVHIIRPLCFTVKFLDFLCLFRDFVSDTVVKAAKKKLKEFTLHMQNMFDVSIEFQQSFNFQTESSKSLTMVASAIIEEINDKVRKTLSFFDIMSVIFSFFFVFIFLKVLAYRYKFLSSDRYDNRYITQHIIDLDLRRLKMDKETVLPLELREKKHYTRAFSFRLLKSEKRKILTSSIFLGVATFKITSYLICDYCQYWILSLIREYGHRKLAKVNPPEVDLHVEGHGFLAKLYRDMAESLHPADANNEVDPVPCLPDPVPPNYQTYVQIAFLTTICWLLAILEPYGLRIRNIVMSYYHPDRAKQRATWLYNHILRSRGGFLKFARRQLRRKLKGGNAPVEAVSLRQYLAARCPIFRWIFGSKKERMCVLCGRPETAELPLTQCSTPDCAGLYCIDCFAFLQNKCSICKNPVDYGDNSDISEERDSSEEDLREERPVEASPSEGPASRASEEIKGEEKFVDVQDRLFLTGNPHQSSVIMENEKVPTYVVNFMRLQNGRPTGGQWGGMPPPPPAQSKQLGESETESIVITDGQCTEIEDESEQEVWVGKRGFFRRGQETEERVGLLRTTERGKDSREAETEEDEIARGRKRATKPLGQKIIDFSKKALKLRREGPKEECMMLMKPKTKKLTKRRMRTKSCSKVELARTLSRRDLDDSSDSPEGRERRGFRRRPFESTDRRDMGPQFDCDLPLPPLPRPTVRQMVYSFENPTSKKNVTVSKTRYGSTSEED